MDVRDGRGNVREGGGHVREGRRNIREGRGDVREGRGDVHENATSRATVKLGSQYVAQLRDAAKRVVPRPVCREFRLRVYPSDAATRSQYTLPRRLNRLFFFFKQVKKKAEYKQNKTN